MRNSNQFKSLIGPVLDPPKTEQMLIAGVMVKIPVLKRRRPSRYYGAGEALHPTIRRADGYASDSNGAIRRLNPKPWANKSEHKRYKKQRRANREFDSGVKAAA